MSPARLCTRSPIARLLIAGCLLPGMPALADYTGTISDSHTHLRVGVKYERVIKAMDQADVDIAVIMSHEADDVTDEDVLEFHKEYPDRIIPAISFQGSRWKNQDPDFMAYVNKLAGGPDYHWLGEASIRGKIDSKLNMPPDHPMVHELLKVGIKHKLPIAFHHNASDPEEVSAFIEVLKQHPQATVIWAHWCGLSTPDKVRALFKELPNLHCDLAWLHKHQEDLPTQLVDDDNNFLPGWKTLIEAQPKRFLVGIDASMPKHYKTKYQKWVKKIRHALGGLSPEVAESVATKNLHEILGRNR